MAQFPLSVGAAKRVLPFPDGFFPYRAWGPRCLTGEHDDLHVRAVCIRAGQPLLMLTVEVGDIPPEWVPRLAEATGLSADQVFLSATHTHTAPHIGGYWPEDVRDAEKGEQFTALAWEATVAAAKEAMASSVPARAAYAAGSCDVNVNRDVCGVDPHSGIECYSTGQNFHGDSDKTVHAVYFLGNNGSPLAVLFSSAVHSSILFGTNIKDRGQLTSGDLAGAAMRHVEAAFPGCTAMFAMAPAADQNPRLSASFMAQDESGRPHPADYGMGCFALVDVLGRELAAEVVSIAGNAADMNAGLVRSVAGTAMIPGKVKKDGPGVPPPRSPADFEPADPVPVPVSAAQLGDLLIAGVGCEVTVPIGRQLRSALEQRGYRNIFLLTQCNGSSSYMADDDAYERVTFTAKASHMMPGASGHLTEALLHVTSMLS